MNQNNKWETIVGILVWVFIISIVILWIGSLINYSRATIDSYDRSTNIQILRDNITAVIKWINVDMLQENDIFYVYKNKTTKTFDVFTWATNEEYKYIDLKWNKIEPADLDSFPWDIYARILYVEREDTSLDDQNKIIRVSLRRLIKSNLN